MTARLLRGALAACLVGGLTAPGLAAAAPPPPPTPGVTTPAVSTVVTDTCPHRQVAPPAVDASEVPKPGQKAPAPLPVPTPPVGGARLAGCGLVVPDGAPPVPQGIDSAGWLVADLTSGTVVAAKDPHGRYRPASTIKLLLAQVALRELNLDTVVSGTAEDAAQEGDAAGVAPGGRYTVRQLLEGLLLISGNDTAHALARQLGGVDTAVAKMNDLAKSLGAKDTRAITPSGLDGPGQTTSPYDLALILQNALRDKRFTDIASTRQITFPGHPPVPTTGPATPLPPGGTPPPAPTSVAPYPIINENRMLTDVPGAVAGKNGYTDDAKKTYVGAVDRDGKRYVVVQLFGLAYTGNTYWDQFRRLLDYGAALSGKSVGSLVAPEGGGAVAPAASPDDPVVEASPGMGTGTRVAIGLGGLVVIGVLVAAAMRTSRGR
ncbi:Peptidase S11 D-alanyl-D-alanine carboxypeptidase 1 OS=Tsukamurella paurometabola (strain ATCC 8368/ DSM / CCUG 35730 / CIP 100753 / JCM 10117 / KCTC 9821/ NBRC 16120 / NCIMB 702349 / NCTC 13040) OX=521096 GN=Tpau_0952 PE=3 SV=1 [Tsukamurella paurometabola]|uniref:Peptidase S11 D-alanyl-D-alanine carboxypeptidase 1 n=1 Tax=Tsukamurella paurometabola (strain ATCC 8368 / DSM 20162 / CCUG 35730 / CIP 100753 / JCM 10117 / KCTC 9821 / NBRC 16120 / NCIMB 702349 / NCTC 13040) TaxID=521096 RepID=D5UUL4_TSUPD|nr:serine hydrolase [Tsukamurella paurometabola]ADG77585.1 peptidase S11 D-alanyl-D-alanine carboxypeptidase 1 [Tsukamurella paurometabola DSM 20162]SUP27817.1 D-alanyl-D-alanine carboxypeptidase dacB precursor [Tsukamurella paurometabola]